MPGINPFQGPIDYSADVKSPFEEALRGFQMGAVGAESRAKAQGLQQDMERNKALGVVMQNLVGKIRNGTAVGADFHEASLLAPPDKAETILKAWDSTSKEQQQGTLAFTSQVMSALDSSTPRIGIDMLNQRAAGDRNSGNEENAKAYETYAKLAELDPANVAAQIGGLISPLPGGKDVIDAWVNSRKERRAEELHPAELTEAQAKAQKAAVDAKFAESGAALDLQKKGWDITKIQEDIQIANKNSSIAAMNAQISREDNMLKREELQLKVDDRIQARDTAVREKAANLENARFNIDNMINTADRILKTPANVVGNATGPVDSRTFTLRESTADFQELIDTFTSQAFLAQLPQIKGLGQLSNIEGQTLKDSLQGLKLRQSSDRLITNVKEVQRLLLKSRKNIAARYGMPDNLPDTPAISTSASDLDALIRKYDTGSQ